MTSKELLEKTGISRATLNNYISWGIVPRPEVLPPEPQDGAAPRIGYFPDAVVARIAEIQRLKQEGWSITRIAEHFAKAQASAAGVSPPARRDPSVAPVPPLAAGVTGLAIDEVAHAAYIVNHRFEVVWANAAATTGVLRRLPPAGPDAGTLNLFKYLIQSQPADEKSQDQVLRFHLGLAKQLQASFAHLCRELSQDDTAMLERLHAQARPPARTLVSHIFVAGTGAAAESVGVYAVQFRDRILFAHVPGELAFDDLSPLSLPRELVARRMPELTEVAVLVADLEHPTRIWSELPAEEYFELLNQIWSTLDPIFRRHHATHGKHAGDGMVCYFFPRHDGNHAWNALAAATEMREAMRQVSREWRLRKGWSRELCLNTGIDAGQQWLGTLRSGNQIEFTMLGDTLTRAARISEFARLGAIWATKNLIAKLSAEEKQRLKFGVRRPDPQGSEVLVRSVFSDMDTLASAAAEKLNDIARLPITEIVEITAANRDRDGAVAQQPI